MAHVSVPYVAAALASFAVSACDVQEPLAIGATPLDHEINMSSVDINAPIEVVSSGEKASAARVRKAMRSALQERSASLGVNTIAISCPVEIGGRGGETHTFTATAYLNPSDPLKLAADGFVTYSYDEESGVKSLLSTGGTESRC